MKNYLHLFLTVIFSVISTGIVAQVNYEVIPLPKSIQHNEGESFALNKSTVISYPKGDKRAKQTAQFLSDYLFELSGLKLAISHKNTRTNTIQLAKNYKHDKKDAYSIEVSQHKITINGAADAGLFHGVQTLRKAIPVNPGTVEVLFPPVTITDYPRFDNRGMMLDVARHFFPVSFVKKYIDILALHNINYLHFHLTDDQGWRIEIKKHPQLTKTGAWRKETLIGKSTQYDGIPYGGFYTQDELKEIVAYASERFITVVPEVDLPGHMLAALTTYPELGCTGGPYEVWTKWGVSDDVLCMGNEATFDFLKDVFSELIEIFPSPYIHIGGDECPKHRWKECSKCQNKIRELGLATDEKHSAEDKLQAYCMSRMGDFLKSKGRKIIGWDEILDGGSIPDAVIMSWHGHQGAIKAARAGLKSIMVPSSYCYFDFYQTLNISNVPLAIGGHLPLEKVYSLEPLPDELTNEQKKLIVAVQANMWTEYIKTPQHVEYMLMPRIDALSEVQWCMPEQKDYNSFVNRLMKMMTIYKKLGYNYAKHVFDIKPELQVDTNKELINLKLSAWGNAPVYYTLDGTDPDKQSSLYKDNISIQNNCIIKAIAYYPDEKSLPYLLDFNFSKASLKPITLTDGYMEPIYTFGGANALIDGLRGGSGYSDGNWIGFLGDKIEAIIDLKHPTSISKVSVGTYVSVNDWIFGAKGLDVLVSDNGIDFSIIKSETYVAPQPDEPVKRVDIETEFTPLETRYVKVIVHKPKYLPEWHPGYGSQVYLFMDEISIY